MVNHYVGLGLETDLVYSSESRWNLFRTFTGPSLVRNSGCHADPFKCSQDAFPLRLKSRKESHVSAHYTCRNSLRNFWSSAVPMKVVLVVWTDVARVFTWKDRVVMINWVGSG